MELPQTFKELSYILDKELHFKNILIVNTETTGSFLDSLFLENRTTRIKYTPNTHDELAKKLKEINQTFDLICLDPFHGYKESSEDLALLTSYLSEDGVLICHDCYPPNSKTASRDFVEGEWCGVTYLAFIEFAFHHSTMFYGIINRDYGLGIISKKEIIYVKQIIYHEKQNKCITLFKNGFDEQAYEYFTTDSNDIINVIN